MYEVALQRLFKKQGQTILKLWQLVIIKGSHTTPQRWLLSAFSAQKHSDYITRAEFSVKPVMLGFQVSAPNFILIICILVLKKLLRLYQLQAPQNLDPPLI